MPKTTLPPSPSYSGATTPSRRRVVMSCDTPSCALMGLATPSQHEPAVPHYRATGTGSPHRGEPSPVRVRGLRSRAVCRHTWPGPRPPGLTHHRDRTRRRAVGVSPLDSHFYLIILQQGGIFKEIARYAADFRDFLKDGTIPEKKALIRNFVERIEVEGDEATLTYTVPMPSDGAMSESASVLDFVKSSPPTLPVDTAVFEMWLGSLSTHRGLAIPVA